MSLAVYGAVVVAERVLVPWARQSGGNVSS